MNHRAIFINLAAQAMDEDINHIRLWIKAVIEDMLEDHGLGDRPIRMAHQILEQSEFARLELDLFAGPPRFTTKMATLRATARAPTRRSSST